jgi:coenzyme F420 hydrogenase subunit beta
VRALAKPLAGAQWTGITTRIAERLLETGAVDAVLTMAARPGRTAGGRCRCWSPRPDHGRLPRHAHGVRAAAGAAGAGARAGHTRLAVIGIPCQVYALRALEAELGFERLYVIGTPCSDNTTTENFHRFLEAARRRIRTRSPTSNSAPTITSNCASTMAASRRSRSCSCRSRNCRT